MEDLAAIVNPTLCWACDAPDGEPHQLWCPSVVRSRAPRDLGAEQTFLSAALQQPALIGEWSEALPVIAFVTRQHQVVWQALRELDGARTPVNPSSLARTLHASGTLADAGGAQYVADLYDLVPWPGVGPYVARRIADVWHVRRIQSALSDAVQAGWQRDVDAPAYADETLRTVTDAVRGVRSESLRGLAEVQTAALAITERRAKGERVGVLTPWSDLNDAILGMEPGRLYIVAGRPGMGKSIFGLDVAAAAAGDGTPSVVFSLEMSAEQLVHRLWASVGSVPLRRIRSGFLDDTHWHRIAKVRAAVAALPLILDDASGLTIEALATRARRYAADGRCGLIVVDYLQIMAGGGLTDSRERDVSEMSRGLKTLAGELRVPVIALSQLNRGVESRTDKRPILSDLRESGAIEQDADAVLMLYRAAAYAKEGTPDAADPRVEVLIRKQRDGETGCVPLRFRGEFTRLDPWNPQPEGRPMTPPARDWSNRDDT